MRDLGVRRVVVAGDATPAGADALSLAGELAARWRVDLHGLFVEDAGLLALADLPFAREHYPGGAAPGGLARAEVESQFAAFAARARQHLAAAAERRGVAWSFEIVRGSIATGPLPFQPTDFLVLEGLSRPFAAGLTMASPWSKVAEAASHPLFLLRDNRRHPGSILALVDEAAATAPSTLGMANWLAETEGRPLTVVAIDGGAGKPGSPTSASRSGPAPQDLPLDDLKALRRRLEQGDCRVLVMSREVQDRGQRELRSLVATARQDILLV